MNREARTHLHFHGATAHYFLSYKQNVNLLENFI